MKTVRVTSGFEEYEDDKLVRRKVGEELTVTNDRADQLRDHGLARAKPQPSPTKADAPEAEAKQDPDKAD